jgi:hypothetical protein
VTSLALAVRRLIGAMGTSTQLPATIRAGKVSEGDADARACSGESGPPRAVVAHFAENIGPATALGPRLRGRHVEEQQQTQQQEAEILKQVFEANLLLRSGLLRLNGAP